MFVDEPFCEDGVVEDGRLLGLVMEVEVVVRLD